MKKEYVKQLETRVAALENQNKTLIEEVNAMRDLYGIKKECLASTEADEYDWKQLQYKYINALHVYNKYIVLKSFISILF